MDLVGGGGGLVRSSCEEQSAHQGIKADVVSVDATDTLYEPGINLTKGRRASTSPLQQPVVISYTLVVTFTN